MQKVVANSDQETTEDFQIALDLLNRYKKDKNFIQRDDEEFKKKNEMLSEVVKSEPKGKVLNPALVQEERHREIQEKRKQRIERQSSQSAVDKVKGTRQASRGP